MYEIKPARCFLDATNNKQSGLEINEREKSLNERARSAIGIVVSFITHRL